MEGFILAAGLGTRLRPLTDDRPKALVEIPVERRVESGEWRTENVSLLEIAIRRLEEAGVEHIVINVHHFAEKVIDFVRGRQWQAAIDISDERAMLLDTGGGLKKASGLFSGRENVLVHNVDILSDVDLRDVERQHREKGNLVTLCVSRRVTKRMLEFGEDGLLVGRSSNTLLSQPQVAASSPSLGEQSNSTALAFSGISVVSPGLFGLLPEAGGPYPVIDEYIRLSASGERIGSYLHSAERWLDVGKPETLEKARLWRLS